MTLPIQSLWIGPRLSVMERLSITSYLAHGHTYHLYVYEEPANLPPGLVLRDASDILPASMIFQYAEYESYAGFSNFFRYQLLLDRGGWWVDTDTVCLKRFPFAEDYVFASEPIKDREVVTNSTMKAPAGSKLLAEAYRICERKNPSDLRWGETGPRLIATLVGQFGLEAYVQPAATFCPVAYDAWEQVLDPEAEWAFAPATHAVHLWNEMWRRAGKDKEAIYHQDCLYETLKRRHLS